MLVSHTRRKGGYNAMMAQNSHTGGSDRRFSAAVSAELVGAMREYQEEVAQSAAALRVALDHAAAEAKERGWGPEDVVVALKAAQAEAGTGHPKNAEAVERFHTTVFRGMLNAYFSSPPDDK